MKKAKNLALILAVTLIASCAFPQQSAAQAMGETSEKLSESTEPENGKEETEEPGTEKPETENFTAAEPAPKEAGTAEPIAAETDTREPVATETGTREPDEAKAPDMKSTYLADNGIDWKTVYVGQSYEDTIPASVTEKRYLFGLRESGRLTLTADASDISSLQYSIYDIDNVNLLRKTPSINKTTNSTSINEEIDLTAGQYYISIKGTGNAGNFFFRLSLSLDSAEESFEEINGPLDNEMAYANPVEFSTSYRGQIAKNDSIDFYKFTLNSSGRISLDASVQIRSVYCHIYDKAGKELWSSYFFTRSGTAQAMDIKNEMDLTKGEYYFSLETPSRTNTGNYSFRLTFKNSGESFSETRGGTNNSLSKANTVRSDITYKGQIAQNDKKDFYKFTVSESSDVTLEAAAEIPWVYYHIYNSSGKELWKQSLAWNKTTERSSLTKKIDLSKGTYYFAVEQYSSYTGNYSFRIHTHSGKITVKKATTKKNGSITRKCSCGKVLSRTTIYRPKKMKLSKTTYVCNGKVKKPSVKITDSSGKVISSTNYTVSYSSGRKKVGKYKVTVKFKGKYKGKMTKTFRIKARK